MTLASKTGERRAEEKAAAAARRELSVFINCPFDGMYSKSLDAIFFTIICCGYEPRSAIDTDATSEFRMERIVDALRASRLSIHDLSRIYGEGAANTARMNMPLELGIAMAMKLSFKKGESKRPHDWTALVPNGAPYHLAVSDLNGHDLKPYQGEQGLVSLVMLWLVTRKDGPRAQFQPTDITKALPGFQSAMESRREGWKGADVPWEQMIEEAKQIALKNGLRTSGYRQADFGA